MYDLETPIEELTNVGKTTASYLNKLGVFNLYDLLYYWPFRYEDFSNTVKIESLRPNENFTVSGKIVYIRTKRARRRRLSITEALLEDKTGSINLVWFNQPYLSKNLKAGEEIYVSGIPTIEGRELQFNSPVYEKVTGWQTINTGKIVPVYPLTARLTQKQLRFLTNFSLQSLELINDWLPREIIEKNDLIPLDEAIKEIHFPESLKRLEKARYRLKFDELFLIQLQSQINKKYLEKTEAPAIKFKQEKIKEFIEKLPFILTNDQKKSAWQILQDLEKNKPMNRLLEGDVGSGKTMVAALAAFNVALNKFQTVLMAPTEILAKQHYMSLVKLFNDFNLKIGLLTKSERLFNDQQIPKEDFIDLLKRGDLDLIIGTHALIQDQIQFNNLGLVIIDEQHRFGVEQRKKLKNKNMAETSPHFLSMTATPIPRSLALIIYGDLDLSIIREMPKGRKKIITKLIAEKQRQDAYKFIRQEISNGRQVFVICPLVDPSDNFGFKSVKEEYKKLDKNIFPDLEIGLLHGKLKSAAKEKIMREFKANQIQILVSTSVIEVGIDVPNATIIMIEGADRFGLAQLHQFRGRVGRGEYQSYCFLFTDNYSLKTRERLQALVKSNDGFALAEYDLKFRGPGEVYGKKQSGLPEFKIASFSDLDLINLTKESVEEFLAKNTISNFPLLELKLANKIEKTHYE